MPTPDFRSLPSVERVLDALGDAAANGGHAAALQAARDAIATARESLASGGASPSLDAITGDARDRLELLQRPSLRRVINASGVILQTNLGRAPLSKPAREAMENAARGYTNLEFDLEAGTRGSRHEHVRDLIRRTTGAEDGIVVNNNAAALFMVLQVFAQGREVIVSRGQAVEIGGGFRIPDVLRQSGATLVEVGTTNRTYARDYSDAITEQTGALLRVHTSNFRVVGFVHEPSASELSSIAAERGVLLIDDLGSGCLLDTTQFGIEHEPTVQESIAAGADLALFSGDKLLGGPQCGIIAGRSELVETLRRHPLARALRVDKLTIAALNATLLSYARGLAVEEIPVWNMVAADEDCVRERAESWVQAAGAAAAVVAATTMVGGGSLPGQGVATWCASVTVAGVERLQRALRDCDPPVVGRVEKGSLLLDPRTVDPADDERVKAVLHQCISMLAFNAEV